ncbi:MAG: DNA polymerase III subunit gamma/tau [Evtepia sp.]|uniref:DNA polymerase III subunit gamma/tau n=1 Tax=Evtepia sp. TaxID=2773933 RepID=UPI002A758F70|nr:DNA polymerase III subunit gamma/tau [Evtepia sp.]MDY3014010.1 DNA polymerase III subunit gamma/tau [Evtepia sp.]
MYQALYRKWRPRTFDDVVGQAHITDTLKRQVAARRLSHAYLFTGTRGTGKTTCAKILARAVNCEHPVDGNPCNCCPSCQGIESGAILDVVELDAASNNGVDQIRALREEAVYTPAAVRKRVYIVDEVHMLSTPAFNALLKILEEPPAHLMFILATTELHKVPATIKSRCQQFAFKRITPKTIAGRLGYVAEQEGISLTVPAAELLARLADGGLRDGLSLLDQCSGAEGDLTEEVVLDVLGLAGNRKTLAIMQCIGREDTAGALAELDALYRDGKDMGAFLGELSSLVRDLLIRKTAPEGGHGLLMGGYEERSLRPLLSQFTSAELVQMLTILQSAQADLYRSSSRRLDAELCVIRLCDRTLSDTPEGLSARISRLEEAAAQGVSIRPAEPAPQTAEPRPAPVTEASPAPAPEEAPPWEELPPPEEEDLPPWDLDPEPQPAPPVEQTPVPRQAPQQQPVARTPVASAQGSRGQWQDLLAHLPALPPMVHSFLHKPESVTGTFEEKTLTIWVDSELTKSFLSRGDTPAMLEQAAQTLTGEKRRVVFQIGRPEVKPETPPQQEDHFSDLMALGQKFGNIEVK